MSIFSILFLLLAGIGVFFYLKARKRARFLGSFDMALFLVMMPKYDVRAREGDRTTVQPNEKELIAHMEQVYANFLYLKKPGFLDGSPRITLEIASQIGGSDISFYVAVPKYLASNFEKYIHGVYPRAVVEAVPQDYTIFEEKDINAAAYLKLKNSPLLPVNTYTRMEKDPLAAITNTLSKIAPNEGAAAQVVIRPLPQGDWRIIGEKAVAKLREGKSIWRATSEAMRSPLAGAFMEFVSSLFAKSPDQEKQKKGPLEFQEPEVDQTTVEAIQQKVAKQVFETNIRLVASAQTKERAQEILGHLMGGFGQFAVYSLNSFEPIEVKRKGKIKKFIYDFIFRNFDEKQKNILNIEELTSVYHFPTRFTETPHIRSAKSAVAPPPLELPKEGLNMIGVVRFRGAEEPVMFAAREDRRRHFYVVGQTGTGKTSLIQEMVRQDIQNGEGVAVIDPHGDLIEATLANIPKERAEDVILFEPFDMERPMGLNMLEYETPEQKDFAVQEMIAIFYKLFPPEIIGPMFEHYMRNAMLALMADIQNPGTLVEIPRMFTDPSFLDKRLARLADPIVKNFWLNEWKQTTGSTKSDMLGYIVSKVGRFIENEMMRNIIGQTHSSFDLARVMDEGKIFLANLSKGQTGEVNSSLLGLILVSKMQMAAMRRGRIPEEERKDFYLYIDEFQNFTTDSVATILSEARKYRLCLVMAHQYIPQLPEEIKNAVLGNVGSMAAFRVGAEDAEFLEKYFEPEFSRFDLVNLDNFRFILKLMIEDKVYPAFQAGTVVPQQGNRAIIEPIKQIAKLKYGRPRDVVEQEIAERSQLMGSPATQ